MSNNSGIKQDSKELVELWEIIQKNPEIGIPKKTEKVSYVYTDYMDKINDYQKKRLAINPDLKKYNFTNYVKIQHLLNKKPYKGSFYYDVLTGLAIAGGFTDWDDYMQQKWPEKYSDLLKPVDENEPSEPLFDLDACNKIDAFKIGKQIIVGWYPKRYVKFEYLGEYRFKFLESSTRKKYTKERIMYADKFDLEMPLVIDKNDMGYPMWPMIIVSYQGNKKVLNFDKVKKENSNL